MQLNRCPCCHSRISIEQMAQDECTTELLGLLVDYADISKSLVIYLGLFRSGKRDLASDRALKLAKEVITLSPERNRLAAAMNETVQAMRQKQDQGAFKPLSNHNYLKRVLETLPADTAETGLPALSGGQMPVKSQSKTSQIIDMLKSYPSPEGVDEWFTRTVCGALSELMLMGLESVPAADTMPMVVERFLIELWPKRKWQKDNHFRGAARLRRAFIDTAEHNKRWPTIKDVLSMVPSQ